jgi:hypothetical protein
MCSRTATRLALGGAESDAAFAGLFGYADGSEWSVSHYRMKAV